MSTVKASRRAVLAFITLADAPTPDEVRFRNDGIAINALDAVTRARLAGTTASLGGDPTVATVVNPYQWGVYQEIELVTVCVECQQNLVDDI